jgi:hypothetical protein
VNKIFSPGIHAWAEKVPGRKNTPKLMASTTNLGVFFLSAIRNLYGLANVHLSRINFKTTTGYQSVILVTCKHFL